ncbi:LysR family transcriptional regulator [Cellvibrio fibrivorans]|uniref:DNA-binding transcriptional LysR family regulator n=1 Tax=Cellvibrio fibrivorans TaxID=126350 RepID=A0ABU1UZB5_9GAMM|nr:LysR family transcriptional regulator [Cellvibrio fibrivorans]MDR7090551.1 DNA-binding transcriptional LysR family regulator [Cellvibrio fibrivorans]
MDRLTEMQIYVAVAESEGFAAAARRLGISPPVATRAVADLEARLGVRLLNRTTRYVRVTDAGQRYLEDARRVLVAADEADEAAIGINTEPRGHLTVTAPVLFGRIYVMPGIVDYLQRFPATEVSALFVDRVVNLLEEGVDVALRIGELGDSSFKALRVGSVRRVLCASPDYLARNGLPANPEALTNHPIIVATNLGTNIEWRFMQDDKPFTVRIKPRLSVTSNDSAIEAAARGLGITRVMSYQVAPELESGKLKIVLSEFEPAPVPIHILHREGRYAATKIRSFIDLMAERLRANKSLN